MGTGLCSWGTWGISRSDSVASGLLVSREPSLMSRAGGEGGQDGTCLTLLPLTSVTHPVLQTCMCTSTELEEGNSMGPEKLQARLLAPQSW